MAALRARGRNAAFSAPSAVIRLFARMCARCGEAVGVFLGEAAASKKEQGFRAWYRCRRRGWDRGVRWEVWVRERL